MNQRVMPCELMEGDEVLARPGFPGRMWVPDKAGHYSLTPLPVYPVFPDSMASLAPPVRLHLVHILGPYAIADRLNHFCPPTFVWLDLREVPLYEVPDGDD